MAIGELNAETKATAKECRIQRPGTVWEGREAEFQRDSKEDWETGATDSAGWDLSTACDDSHFNRRTSMRPLFFTITFVLPRKHAGAIADGSSQKWERRWNM